MMLIRLIELMSSCLWGINPQLRINGNIGERNISLPLNALMGELQLTSVKYMERLTLEGQRLEDFFDL